MGRISVVDVEARQDDVRDMILAGKPMKYIKQFIMQKYSVGLSTVERYITAVNTDIDEYYKSQHGKVIALHISRYEDMYDKSMQVGNIRDAAKVLRQKEELMNVLKQAPLIAVQNNNMNFDNLTVEEIERLLHGINPDTEDNKTTVIKKLL
jgi:hypothetical protein